VTPFNSDPSLVVMSAAGQARQIPIPVNGIVLGRDTDLGPPFTTDPYVSRNHVSVQRRGDVVEIADLGSANGTYVNGTRVHTPTRLQGSDVLRIGQVELTLAAPGRAAMGARPGAVMGAPCLTVVAPDAFSGRQFLLPGDYAAVGRNPASDICLDDPYVSWSHAALWRRPNAVFVQDLGSTSGTFVNGQAVTASRQLCPGDIVAFAGVSARFD
jgi:ABC transport system ATP-binding/permease protein